jgi:hypothetical protein
MKVECETNATTRALVIIAILVWIAATIEVNNNNKHHGTAGAPISLPADFLLLNNNVMMIMLWWWGSD